MLSEHDIPKLRMLGDRKIKVYKKPMHVEPIMMGTERAALVKGDFLSNLGFRFLKNQLKENVALSRSAHLHSYDPVAPYAQGSMFGQGEGGRW